MPRNPLNMQFRTVGYFDVSDMSGDVHAYEICARLRSAAK
jgi:hypothetical protein